MATRGPQVATVNGGALTLYDSAAGDKVSGIKKPTRMILNNTGGSSATLTVNPPGKTSYGVNNPSKAFTIPVGYYELLLLPAYRDPDDGNLIALSWSATGSTLKWAVIG